MCFNIFAQIFIYLIFFSFFAWVRYKRKPTFVKQNVFININKYLYDFSAVVLIHIYLILLKHFYFIYVSFLAILLRLVFFAIVILTLIYKNIKMYLNIWACKQKKKIKKNMKEFAFRTFSTRAKPNRKPDSLKCQTKIEIV